MPACAFLLSAVLLFLTDQSAKRWALTRLGNGRAVVFGGLRLCAVLHHPAGDPAARYGLRLVALWLAATVTLGTLVQLGPFFQGTVASVALGAAVGGAASNLADRLWRHGVVDIVDLRVWPVFNLADVAIVGGATIGALYV